MLQWLMQTLIESVCGIVSDTHIYIHTLSHTVETTGRITSLLPEQGMCIPTRTHIHIGKTTGKMSLKKKTRQQRGTKNEETETWLRVRYLGQKLFYLLGTTKTQAGTGRRSTSLRLPCSSPTTRCIAVRAPYNRHTSTCLTTKGTSAHP